MDSSNKYDYRMPPEMQRNNRIKSILLVALTLVVACAAIAGGYLAWRRFGNERPATALPVADAPYTHSVPKRPGEEVSGGSLYPAGKLFVTPERSAYRDGELILEIPKLDLNEPVLSLPDPDIEGEAAVDKRLNDGIGLFYCAQLPGEGNPNVSIAGHRDIFGREFYYLDTLTTGDIFYLTWQGKRYVYEYIDTILIDPDDAPEVIWQPMMTKDFSAITLQTCDPIGIASHRMFVTGRLVSVGDL